MPAFLLFTIHQSLFTACSLVVVLIRTDAAIPVHEVAVTSAHQAIGALILATAASLAAWSLHAVTAPGASGVASRAAAGSVAA